MDTFDKIFPKDSSLIEKYEAINKLLRKLDKKIVIVIDDLDRLNKDEIWHVLRLIRNTANFYKTIFILAYDREYVNSAVDSIVSSKSDVFLEKFVNCEIGIPLRKPGVIINILKFYFQKQFPDKKIEYSFLSNIPIEGKLLFDNESHYIYKHITSLRDIKRFWNLFVVKFNLLSSDVNLQNFFNLVLFEFNYPREYQVFKDKINYVLVSHLAAISDKDSLGEVKPDIEFVSRMLSDDPNFIELINKIFELPQIDMPYNSIIYKVKYQRYFTLNLFDEYSSQEISLDNDLQNIKHKIQENFNKNKFSSSLEVDRFFYSFANKTKYVKTEEFKKIIKILIEITFYEKAYHTTYLLVEFLNKDKSLIENHFREGNGFNLFLKNELQNAQPPFFESSFLVVVLKEYIYKKDSFSFYLSEDEIKKILLDFLKTYIELINKGETKFDNHVWRLYYSCIERINAEKTIVLMDKANDLFREFVTLKPDEYFKQILRYKYQPTSNDFVFEPFLKQTFNGFENFYKFLTIDKLKGNEKKFREKIASCFTRFQNANFNSFKLSIEEVEFLNEYLTNKIEYHERSMDN